MTRDERFTAEVDVTTTIEREHRWFEYGQWFVGFGGSMDPHRCGDPGTICEWRERAVTVTPWSDWKRGIPPTDGRGPKTCPRCGQVCTYDGWDHVHGDGRGIGSCPILPGETTEETR